MIKKFFLYPLKKIIWLMALVVALSGCGDDVKPISGNSAEETYNLAIGLYRSGSYEMAAKTFETIPYLFPYSGSVKNAYIMAAYSYYQAEDKVNAGASVDVFLSLYPNDPLAAYALYLRGMSYFEQIEDVRRDQSLTEEALKSFKQLIELFPNTVYAKDANSKSGLVYDQLAGKEMAVGRFYLNRGETTAAVNRFKNVVDLYGQTIHVPEALARLVEIYIMIGIIDEAQRYAAILGKNYQSSSWYRYSYDLVKKNKTRRRPNSAVPRPLSNKKKSVSPPN
ncbi:MAG: outer membrane protein assembly factor BamD [Alphaproteobacteria bacterium]